MLNRIKAAFAVLFGGTPEVATVSIPNPTAQIRALFSDSRFTWRSIEALHQASGLATIDQTRALVISLGARRSELTREVYTLPSFGAQSESVVSVGPNAIDRITAALKDSRFQWRSIGALAKASRLSIDETRAVLDTMAVRRGTDAVGEKELYSIH